MIMAHLTLPAPKRERASAVSSFRISLLRFEAEMLVSSSVRRCKHEGRERGERRSCQTGTNSSATFTSEQPKGKTDDNDVRRDHRRKEGTR